jgi:archaellum biogenesis protein FlaJ (TadC family)
VTQRDPLQRNEILNTIKGFLRSIPHFGDYYLRDFQSVYLTSGLTRYIDEYKHRAAIITIMSIPVFFLASASILGILLRWSMANTMLAGIATTLIGSSIIASSFIYYPYYRQHENRARLEDGLIYSLSYMAVLSASGMGIERIIDRITEVEDNPPLILLAKKFIMNIRLFGMDVRSALNDISEMSPSKTFSKQIDSMRTALATSGDLKSLLIYEVQRQVQVKREQLKAKINTLVYVGELYVALMVITPTIFIIIISVLSVLGTSVGGGSVIQLNLIVFIGIPIMGGIFMLLLDQTLGREE